MGLTASRVQGLRTISRPQGVPEPQTAKAEVGSSGQLAEASGHWQPNVDTSGGASLPLAPHCFLSLGSG
jgi:hypothetical protein